MALQVWLPLTKDLRNQGLENITVTTSNTNAFQNEGKLGNKSLDVSGHYAFKVPSLVKKRVFSCSFWYKPITNSSLSDNWRRIIVFDTYTSDGSTTGAIFRFESSYGYQSSSTSYCISIHNNVGEPIASIGTSLGYSDGWDKWQHIAITADGTTLKCYRDGVQIASGAMSNGGMLQGTVHIGYSGNRPVGRLNDFRLYDHCLSPMEVKELSKGLVLHYLLNNQYETGQVNKYSSPYSDGHCSSSTWVQTQLTDERGWNYKLTKTGDGNNSWPNCAVPTYSFTSGKTYYYSAKVRCNKWTNGTLTLRASRSSNDWVTRGVIVCSPSLTDGKWHEYYTYQIVNDTYDRSGTTVTCAPVLEFYCSNMNGNGTIYDMDFDLKDIQVIESDCYVPFIENSFVGTTVHDCSGFCNNGTLWAYDTGGAITYMNDSPKYQASTYINSDNNTTNTASGSRYIYGNCELTAPQYLTVAFWCKPIAGYGNSTGQGQFSLTNYAIGAVAGQDYDTAPMNHRDSVVDMCTSSGTHKYVSIAFTANEWHHYTIVYDGRYGRVYKDGVATGATLDMGSVLPLKDMKGAVIGFSKAGGVWRSNKSYYSDFRIYATALSADDVKSLYQNSAYIDSSGNVYGAVHSEV